MKKPSTSPIVKLQLSAKVKSWRVHDSDDERATNRDEYEQVRANVLRRDKFTCQCCGFKTISHPTSPKKTLLYSGYLEVHHVDDDHTNNVMENLLTVCPFCHSVFHCGFAGHSGAGNLALMPYLKQEDISILFNLLAVIKVTDESEYKSVSAEIVSFFEYFEHVAEGIFDGLSDAAIMGSVLVGTQIKDSEAARDMKNVLWAMRLIPSLDSDVFSKASVYWKNNQAWLPEGQWASILKDFMKKSLKQNK